MIQRTGRCVVLAIGVALTAPLAVGAGCLDVNAGAAFFGDFGLEVTVSDTCLPADLVVEPPPPDVSGEFNASQSVTGVGVRVVAPGAEFGAGQRVVLEDGFSVGAGAPFSATIEQLLDSPFGFVEDASPAAATGYGVKFYLDLDGLTITAADRLDIFSAYSEDGTLQFRATVTHNETLGEDRLVLAALEDGGGLVETPFGEEIVLPPGYNSIQLHWLALGGTGSLQVSVNGGGFGGLDNLDNDQSRVDLARLGATDGTVNGVSGSLALDDFSSFPLAP